MALIDAFTLASTTVVQVITLTSGVLALTVTFAKDYLIKSKDSGFIPLKVSWACEVVSLFAGIWGLMALTGQIASTEVDSPSVWSYKVTIPVGIQIVSFFVAMVALVVAGYRSFK